MRHKFDIGRWGRGLALAGLIAGFGAAPALAADEEAHMHMHHLHLMINHAVEMAAEGANLVMLGEMGMSKKTDQKTIDHGKAMIKQAEGMLNEALAGDAMKKLHEGGAGESKQMAYTHKLGETAKAYIAELQNME